MHHHLMFLIIIVVIIFCLNARLCSQWPIQPGFWRVLSALFASVHSPLSKIYGGMVPFIKVLFNSKEQHDPY